MTTDQLRGGLWPGVADEARLRQRSEDNLEGGHPGPSTGVFVQNPVSSRHLDRPGS